MQGKEREGRKDSDQLTSSRLASRAIPKRNTSLPPALKKIRDTGHSAAHPPHLPSSRSASLTVTTLSSIALSRSAAATIGSFHPSTGAPFRNGRPHAGPTAGTIRSPDQSLESTASSALVAAAGSGASASGFMHRLTSHQGEMSARPRNVRPGLVGWSSAGGKGLRAGCGRTRWESSPQARLAPAESPARMMEDGGRGLPDSLPPPASR